MTGLETRIGTYEELAELCAVLNEQLREATQVMRDEHQVSAWQARCDVGIRGWLEYEFEMSKAVRSES